MDGVVIADFKPDWLEWIAPERFDDADLYRIVTFFVFHSPCPQSSAMSKTLQEYGWGNPWKSPYNLRQHLCEVSSNTELLFPAQNLKEMEITLKQANLYDNFPTDLSEERICFYDSESNHFLSVFKHLRNSLAHGRLNMRDVNGECVFVFEDVSRQVIPGHNPVSARMILRKSTLLKWIDIIEGGQCEYVTTTKPKSKKTKTVEEMA